MTTPSPRKVRDATLLLSGISREALSIYRPFLPEQLRMHLSMASERLMMGGNRSGKTVSVVAEIASAAMGKPITGVDGKPLPMKYPTNRPLTIWVVGYDEKHIGQTLYRMLFTKNNSVSMIQDEGKFRAWNPFTDQDRRAERMESDPFIPDRAIQDMSFRSKGEKLFTVCRLKNGTEIYSYSSKADPKPGDPVDLIWIDEKIKYSGHYAEWQARLSDRKGRMIWSSWPARGNEALLNLFHRAEEDEKKPAAKRDVEKFQLEFDKNSFIEKNEIRKRLAGWSPAQRVARNKGLFALESTLMYPTFSSELHGVHQSQGPNDKIYEILKQTNGQPPHDWCRYLIKDPGQTQAAALFLAVPPPAYGDIVYAYDEMYPQHQTADEFARQVAEKVLGQPKFQAFLIDGRAGRQTPLQGGPNIEQLFAAAFKTHGLASVETGHGFQFGSDDIAGRTAVVRQWLMIREDGTTKFRIAADRMPNTLMEFQKYSRKVNSKEEAQEEPENRHNHIMNTLEYGAHYGCKYVQPERKMRRWENQQQKPKPVWMMAGRAPRQQNHREGESLLA